MTSEYSSLSKFWIAGVAAGVVILLVGFSLRSLVLLFAEPKPDGIVRPESAMAETMQNVGANNGEQVMQNHAQAEDSITAPLSAPASPVQASEQASEFMVDYQARSERESGRKEMINNLREIAKDNPESGYAMTAEQLRKLDRSGASLQ